MYSLDEASSVPAYSGLMDSDTNCHGCNDSYGSNGGVESNQACQVLNVAQGESKLIKQLCICSLDGKHWCFVHNGVLVANDPQMGTVNDFGFMSDALLYTPLFRPAIYLEASNLCDWACNAHSIVKESDVLSYMGARIRVPTELNINNWRSVSGNYNDQLILDYLEYGFPLCLNKNDLQFSTNVNHSSAVNYPSDVDTKLL